SLREFTEIRLVPRESQAEPNRHPASYTPEQLRRWMETVTFARDGRQEPLFGSDELAELPGPLSQALASAGPGDDIILLSTSRRDSGILASPLGITARIFVQGDALNLIVQEARLDFVNAYRGSRLLPEFQFGSRARGGDVRLASAQGEARRGDWLAFRGTPAQVPAPALTTATPAAPAAAAPAPSGARPAAAGQTAVPATRDARFYEEQEQRLQALKRLRERDLITEEEYQTKRREILQSL
ncbi:MAG TPA: SHOCT domain-containing protein, partial [Burkholderiaceae bacterium]|nr:SHOCT domain-containing protein [Burkholderiaceae bacterium]